MTIVNIFYKDLQVATDRIMSLDLGTESVKVEEVQLDETLII